MQYYRGAEIITIVFRGRPRRESMVRKEREIDLKRDSMYVDPMNTEGFGEREPWRERVGELEVWKIFAMLSLN